MLKKADREATAKSEKGATVEQNKQEASRQTDGRDNKTWK